MTLTSSHLPTQNERRQIQRFYGYTNRKKTVGLVASTVMFVLLTLPSVT
jgi:hypothetical protein